MKNKELIKSDKVCAGDKKIPDGKFRIIKIGKAALFEFLCEAINENKARFFDAESTASDPIFTRFDMDSESCEFIAIAHGDIDEREQYEFDNIDTKLLLGAMDDTAYTMLDGVCYSELTVDEIEKLEKRQRKVEKKVEKEEMKAQKKNEKKQKRDAKKK